MEHLDIAAVGNFLVPCQLNIGIKMWLSHILQWFYIWFVCSRFFFCYILCVHFCIPCKHNIIIWNRKWCCSKTHGNIISYEAYHCNWYERIYLLKHIIVPEIKCLWSQYTSPMKTILSDATTFSIGWMYDILSMASSSGISWYIIWRINFYYLNI